MTSLRGRVYTRLGRLSARLPPFRGRARIFLALHRLLGLQREHLIVSTELSRPVRYRAELDLRSWAQRLAFLTGGYEDDTVELLLRLHGATGRAGYLLDVGANVGLIALPFAIAVGGAPPRVVAVEAVPDNVAALTRNIMANGLEETMPVVPVGLGDEAKRVFIQVEGDLRSGEGSGTANILPDGSTYDCVRQELRIETLDGLAGAGTIPPACSLIKIDTDGYDLKVLQGGTAFLARERPIVFGEFSAECMGWHGQSVDDVTAFAAAHGYVVWARVGATTTFTRSLDRARFTQDLLLVPAEQQERVWAVVGASAAA